MNFNTQKEQSMDLDSANRSTKDIPIVALGASAGGLEALTQFLSNTPKDSGIALIIIQHLDPSHSSSLVELLARHSKIDITEAKNNDIIEPNRAYVIPPGMSMSIHSRTLILEKQMEHPGLTHSINLFFRSLADGVKERSVAIILSGTGSDGTEGARAIKEQDGLVIVQDPDTAKYDGMPRSAIAAGLADFILPPEDMPAKLIEYLQQSFNKRMKVRQTLKRDDSKLKSIFSLIKARTGRDFSGYKLSSINRRIEHRMIINKVERIEDYLRLLQEKPTEVEDLMNDFLIQVTSFFRDKEAFASLKQAIEKMILTKPEGSQLRAWTPGCSTGEEAYSIAMVMLECVEESGRNYEVQVFGTDLDAAAISVARSGTYPDLVIQDVCVERRKRFFNKIDSSYQIKKNVRDCVVYAVHDLVTDPPYSCLDLVSVRNLLIYFDSELQKKILPLLHYSLNDGGLLFLGTSETIGEFSNLFTITDSQWRIYRAKGHKKNLPTSIFTSSRLYGNSEENLSGTKDQTQWAVEPYLLLAALPPSILIDRKYQVLYTHGDTSKYLRISEGRLSNRILDLAKPEMERALATLLHEASLGQNEVVRENFQISSDGRNQLVRITVRLLSKLEGNLIVTFEDLPMPKRRTTKGKPVTEAQHQEIEHELQRTRDALGGTIEELRTANEELRSANEEYTSSNEELRSANEELATSREELQSVNEELTTLNTESLKKNEDLNSLNNDMKNLLNATGVATVFLDEQLRIRRFTPAAAQLFNFINSDIGRPVEDISSPLKENTLIKSARQVLENLIRVDQEVQTADNRWFFLRILPYRTIDNYIAGVVVSFIDINQVKCAMQYAQDIIDSIREPLLVLDDKLRVISAGQAFYRTFQVKQEETAGQLVYDLGNRQWDIPKLREVLNEVLEKNTFFEDYQIEHVFPKIGPRVMLLNARRIYDDKATQSILLVIKDITGRSCMDAGPEVTRPISNESEEDLKNE